MGIQLPSVGITVRNSGGGSAVSAEVVSPTTNKAFSYSTSTLSWFLYTA